MSTLPRHEAREFSFRARARGDVLGEEGIDVPRHLDALRRGRWVVLAVTLLGTALGVGVSLLLPPTYTATASIVDQAGTTAGSAVDVNALSRQLATAQRLLVTPDVLAVAAGHLPGETTRSLQDAVTSSTDPGANLLYVTATASDPRRAAARANAVATAFLGGRGSPAQAGGADLRLAQRALPPDNPTSPRPVLTGLIAFFVALFGSVLLVLGRYRLAPRVHDAAEWSRLLASPLLSAVPVVRGRGRRRQMSTALEHESYQTLGSAVRFSLPADTGPHLLLVTSALPGEGKSTVAARLGRVLAAAGHRTLLVSADLRRPRLHEMVGAAAEPGLAELLALAEDGDPAVDAALEASLTRRRTATGGELALLPSGRLPADPVRLLAGPALDAVLRRVRELGYGYVLVDGPPLLGLADAQELARRIPQLLVVGRLDHAEFVAQAVEVREMVERLEARPLGLVVIGARTLPSAYYAGVASSPSGEP